MMKIFKSRLFSFVACICLLTAFASVTAFATDVATASPTPEPTPTPKPKTELRVGKEYKKVYDGKEAGKSEVLSILSSKSGNGVTYFTYKWYDADGKKLDGNPTNAGTYKLEIKVADKDPVYTGSATVAYIIQHRPLEWDVSGLTVSKPYDGTADSATVKGELLINGIIDGDDVYISYDNIKAADFPNADVQRTKLPITVEGAKLKGKDAQNYILPKLSPEVEASIVKAYITELSFPDNDNKYRAVVEEKVVVSADLLETDFNSADAVKNALRTKAAEALADQEDVNYAYYTAVLQVYKDGQWVEVTAEENPSDGAAIILPYPDGTKDSSHKFVVYKMKTQGKDSGTIEVWAHTEKVEGLEVTLSQGEPMIVAYTKNQLSKPLLLGLGGVSAAAILAVVFFKLLKKDREDVAEEIEKTTEN